MRVCFDPARLRPFIDNWEALASAHVQQLHREMLAGLWPDDASALLDELLSFPSVPFAWRRFDPQPHDVTLQELRIECMYPADAGTDAFARALAAQG